ncbi:MAG: hypothetical protein ACD_7C00343G0002 [uncultured bacterium]|nr:MAG: hypothetical protein ACD_7C00343G0002 [uncultured bacterium]
MNLPVVPTIKSVTDLRYQTAEIIRLLKENKPIVVTRDSDMVAVMLSPSLYQLIIFHIEQFEEKNEAKKLEKAIKRKGEFINFDIFDKKQRKKLKIK